MTKTDLKSLLITLMLIGTLASCSWGRKKADGEVEAFQDEASAEQADAGTDAVNGAVSAAAPDGKTASTSAYTAPKTEAFEAEGAAGTWMNAYYYVRSKDETLATISQAVYGTPDREKDLAKWNQRKKVNVGSLIYYSSPTRADDHAKILSFTEDKGQALEEIEVKSGETISKIAQNRFGDFRTWREIAALNPQVDPNRVVPGTKLKVAPSGTQMVAGTTVTAGNAADVGTAPVVPAAPETAIVPNQAAPVAPQADINTQPAVAQPSTQSAAAPAFNQDGGGAVVPPPAPVDAVANSPAASAPVMDSQPVAPKRGPASAPKSAETKTDREPAEAEEGWQAKLGPAYTMLTENPALAGAVGLLALGLIGLGVRRLRSS